MDWSTISLYICCIALILLYYVQDKKLTKLEKDYKALADLLPPDDFADDDEP